ncbi:MAG: hypothetical protein QW794_08315 [Thermosphaera sp.]
MSFAVRVVVGNARPRVTLVHAQVIEEVSHTPFGALYCALSWARHDLREG